MVRVGLAVLAAPDDERVLVTVVLCVGEALDVGETLTVAASGRLLLGGEPEKVMLADDDGQTATVELPLHKLSCPGPPKKQCS